MRKKAGANTPASRGTVVLRSILDSPGGGQSLALGLASDEGMLLVNMPLENSLLSSAPEYLTVKDLIRVNVAGQFGLARLGDSDVELVRIKQGKINLEAQGKSVDLGIAAPPGVQTPAEENWSLLIHNSRITVLHRPKDPEASSVNEGSSPIHVWTPQSGKWTTFRVPGAIPAVKNLGGWIAGAAAVESLDRQSPGAVDRRQHSPPAADVNSTPPPRPAVPTRPVTDEMFRQSRRFYGGVLFLIDPQSGRYSGIGRGGRRDHRCALGLLR
jgi:hypothetical protein